MIIEGTDRLSDVLNAIGPFLNNNLSFSFYSKVKSNLSHRVSRHYHEYVTQGTVLIYVAQGTIQTNNSYMPLTNYCQNILALDNMFYVLYLDMLPDEVKNGIEIHWIVCEKKKSIIKGVHLAQLIPIDFLLDRRTNNTVGRLNYLEMEYVLLNAVGKKTIDSLFVHKNSKNLFASLLNIFSSAKKAKYASKKDILNFQNLTRTNKDYYKNLVYRIHCPMCSMKKSIILLESNITGKNYKKPDDMIRLIRKDKKIYAEFVCRQCRELNNRKPVFIREIEKQPKTSQEKDMLFLCIYQQYLESNNGISNRLINDKIISILDK